MRVLKYSVPVDDRWHVLQVAGPLLHVACQYGPESVQVWASDAPSPVRQFRVFGTGQVVDGGPEAERFTYHHAGSAITAGGALVWHLFERVAR